MAKLANILTIIAMLIGIITLIMMPLHVVFDIGNEKLIISSFFTSMILFFIIIFIRTIHDQKK